MNTIIAAALAILLALGYGLWSWNEIDSLQEKNTALTAEIKRAEKQKKIDDAVIDELDRKKAEIQIVEKEVIKEVTVYEKNPNAGKCVIPPEFVHAYNLSVSKTASGANEAIETPKTATKISDIDVLKVSTENNISAVENINQCESLMDWVSHVSAKK